MADHKELCPLLLKKDLMESPCYLVFDTLLYFDRIAADVFYLHNNSDSHCSLWLEVNRAMANLTMNHNRLYADFDIMIDSDMFDYN